MAIGQRLVNLGNFDGSVSSGGIMQFNPPRKNTYNAFYFRVNDANGNPVSGSDIDAKIGDIEMSVNGDQKIKLAARFLRAIFKARTGFNCPDGYIPILFANDKYINYEQKVLTSWGMADVQSFQVYLHFNGVDVTGIKDVVCYADLTPVESVLGLHQCYTYQTSGIIPASGGTSASPTGGTLDCTTLSTFGNDARLQALYINNPMPKASDASNYIKITGEYLEANGVINLRQNITTLESEIANLAFGNEVPTILGSAFRFDSGDDIRATLAMANITQLRYRCETASVGTTAASQVFTFIYEYMRGYTSTEKKLQTA